MAVYTHIDERSLTDFLCHYDLGNLKSFKGIAQGVSNSNFHVFTDRGRYILTIFEGDQICAQDLSFFFSYASHLSGKGIVCPQAYRNQEGALVGSLMGKPAAFVAFLDGAGLARGEETPDHCAQMGAFTARIHLAAADFPQDIANVEGMSAWRLMFEHVRGGLSDYQAGLEDIIARELDYLEAHWPKNLPEAVVHLDLFPENVFFQGGKISAMIDMYLAATDFLIFDLAIVVNAWCFNEKNEFCPARYEALMAAYELTRALTPEELAAFQIVCRGASMRFLLSRLEELFAYNADDLMTPHDPLDYLRRLEFHQNRDVARDGT